MRMRRACWTRVRRGKNERLDLPEEREKEGKLSGCWKDWRRGVARDGASEMGYDGGGGCGGGGGEVVMFNDD